MINANAKFRQTTFRGVLRATMSVAAVVAVTSSAIAGGFAIREQSVSSQGASFAGSAAGGDLSSIFWNPAATGVKNGLNTESHTAIILPRANIEVDSATNVVPAVQAAFDASGTKSGDIGNVALVGASYGNYQLSRDLWLGFGLNSPFGLTTKPGVSDYKGAVLGRSARLLTINANPTIAYQIMPGVLIGAGFQAQWADAELKFATGIPQAASTFFEGDDWAFGGTAGILFQPSDSTSIGIGYRSRLSHTIEGTFGTVGTALQVGGEADLDLPDIVTLSVSHAVTPAIRLLGTVEWSNWSQFEDLTVISTEAGATALTGPIGGGAQIATIPANWDDGWFFSLGAEYDVSSTITVRSGVAYEISPVDEPEKRIISIPDSDRIWLSFGATMKVTESMELDLAFTHIWLEDERFVRESVATTAPGLPPQTSITGSTEARTNII